MTRPLLAVSLALLCGCGGAFAVAQKVTIFSGDAVMVADQLIEAQRPQLIARWEREALEAEPTDEAARIVHFERVSAPLQTASDAVDVAARAWRAMVAGLAAWDAGNGDDASWQRLAMCLAASLANVISGLQVMHVSIPEVLAAAANDTGQFAERMCGTLPASSEVHGTPEVTR
jgi:hypothetical protein